MAAEKNFENRVKDFLKEQGCWFLKTWSNGVQRSGVPDILACYNGYFFGIELKAPKGTPSDLQIYNLLQIDKSGGYAILLYPKDFELFKSLMNDIASGDCNDGRYYHFFKLLQEWKERLEL